MNTPHLTLASASPRRLDLLKRIGIAPDVIAPCDIDETPLPGELARDYARRMAREKAAACPAQGTHILAGDTVVAVGRRILPKADSRAQAQDCLSLLSGRRHRVYCAIALQSPDGSLREKLNTTIVKFKRLSREEIDHYLTSGEWRGKAGAYAIQGAAEGLILSISGSHSAVMGLPLFETRALLKSVGFRLG